NISAVDLQLPRHRLGLTHHRTVANQAVLERPIEPLPHQGKPEMSSGWAPDGPATLMFHTTGWAVPILVPSSTRHFSNAGSNSRWLSGHLPAGGPSGGWGRFP